MSKLNLAVGQSWRTRCGEIVTVDASVGGVMFSVKHEHLASAGYNVDASGRAHRYSECDLVERVERVYIAGPMTGLPGLNFPAFNAAASEYRNRGCFVINPAELGGGDIEVEQTASMSAEQQAEHWRNCMKKDIPLLLSCETIVLLDGWQHSRGARLEHHTAREIGLTICYP